MDRPWWVEVIKWGLWLVLMTAVMGWLGRTRKSTIVVGGGDGVMIYPRSMLILGIVGLLMFFGGVVGAYFTGETGALLLLLFFGLWCFQPIAEWARVRHQIEPEGLRYQTVFGRRGVLRWSDVRRVRYSDMGKWFRLDGAQGATVRVSAMLTGLEAFSKALIEEVPREHFSDDAFEIAHRATQGVLPKIWG